MDISIGRDNYIQAGVKVKVGPFHKWFRPELVVSSSTQSGRVVLEIVTPGYAGLLWIGDWLKERLLRAFQLGNDVFFSISSRYL